MELTLESLSKYLKETHKSILDAAKGLIVDREAKIVDPLFNDQPIGRSKAVLTGRVYKVTTALIIDGEIHVKLDGIRHYMKLTQLEIME